MLKSLFTAAFASLAGAEFIIQNGPVSKENPTIYPGLNDLLTIGEPAELKWTNTTSGFLNIYLLRGPGNDIKFLSVIAENYPNNGSYYWNVPHTLEPDTSRYGLRLDESVDGKSTSVYQYSPQFGMKKSDKTTPTSTPSSIRTYTSTSSSSTSAPVPTDEPHIKPNHFTSSTIVYSTHYQTVTSCDCEPTGVPSPTTYPLPPSVTGTPGHYNTTNNETFVPSNIPYTGGATGLKAGGAIIAIAAGIVVFFL